MLELTLIRKVISLLPNSLVPELGDGSAAVMDFSGDLGAAGVQFKELKTQGGSIPLPEAELVVSAGRGLKGPENWGIVEDLANSLGLLQLVADLWPILVGDLTTSTLGKQVWRSVRICISLLEFLAQFSIWPV